VFSAVFILEVRSPRSATAVAGSGANGVLLNWANENSEIMPSTATAAAVLHAAPMVTRFAVQPAIWVEWEVVLMACS
jgi:hypothetical protein